MARGKNEPNGKHWSTKPHKENSRLINSFPHQQPDEPMCPGKASSSCCTSGVYWWA